MKRKSRMGSYLGNHIARNHRQEDIHTCKIEDTEQKKINLTYLLALELMHPVLFT